MLTTVIIAEDYHCIGSSKFLFDDYGICVSDELPWRSMYDFRLAFEQVEMLSELEFYNNVPVDPFIEQEIDGHYVEFMTADGVYMIFDQDTDVFYFFV